MLEREIRKSEGATFQPRLSATAPARAGGSPGRGARGAGFEERLHPTEQQLLEKKARGEAVKYMRDLNGCTFQVWYARD